MWARTFAGLFAAGCIAQVQSAFNPTPSGSGTCAGSPPPSPPAAPAQAASS